jgi:tetratricopeptide (TPR) repeat protein
MLFGAVGAVAVLSGSPTGLLAQTRDRPAADEAAGDRPEAPLQARYDRLYRTMLADPRDLDVMFDFAQLAGRLGRIEQAITTYERMLLITPDLPRVKLELGVLYYRLGSFQAARGYFEQVEAEPDLPRPVRRRVEAFLDRIGDGERRHGFAFSTSLGVRHQSNATAAPGDDGVLVGDRLFKLDDAFQNQPDWSLYASQYVQHTYDLETGLQESWETTLFGYLSRYQDLPRLDIDVVEATSGPRLALLPAALEATVRPHVRASHVRLGRDSYYDSYGGGVSGDILIGQRAAASAEYRVVYQSFATPAQRANADDADGVEHDARLTGRYALTPQVTLLAGVGAGRLNANAGFESYTEGRVRAGGDYSYRPPLLDTGYRWRVSLRASRTWTHYDAPDPVIAAGRTRQDDTWRLSLSHSARVSDRVTLDAQIDVTDNQSTIRNFEYDNTSFLAGITVTF